MRPSIRLSLYLLQQSDVSLDVGRTDSGMTWQVDNPFACCFADRTITMSITNRRQICLPGMHGSLEPLAQREPLPAGRRPEHRATASEIRQPDINRLVAAG